MSLQIIPPQQIYYDKDGTPLDSGFIYIGELDQNPETNQVSVYWDPLLTEPAAQPIRTLNGFPSRQGGVSALYTNSAFSITVRNKRGELVFSSKSGASNGGAFSLLIFSEYFAAATAATTLNNGIYVEVLETGGRYEVIGGQLVFVSPLTQKVMPCIDNYLQGSKADPSVVTAALLAMQADVGFVRFAYGEYPLNNVSIDVPAYFLPEAYIDAQAGQNVRFTSQITSPKQWIFQGAGTYTLEHDNTLNQGEYARQVHISWFGAFPYPNPSIVPDQAMYFQAANAAFGNVREGIIQMDMGTYYLKSNVIQNRGVHLVGMGTRRTAIRAAADNFDLFTTGNTACRFSEFGFENYGSLVRTSGCYINVQHSSCEIYNVNLPTAKNGIRSIGSDLRIKNIIGSFGSSIAQSSIVKIEGGSNIDIDGIIFGSSSNFGPSFVVDITNRDSGQSIGFVSVNGIKSIMPSPLVNIEAATANISAIDISGLFGEAFSGANPDALINISVNGAYTINGVTISKAFANTYYSRFLRIRLQNSGSVKNITVDSSIADGTTLTGVDIEGDVGTTLQNAIFAGTFINNRAFDYKTDLMLGSLINYNIDPNARANTNPSICTGFVINDDSVATIPLNRAVNNGFLMVSAGYQNYIILAIRAATTPQATTINTSANMAVVTTALNGTSGVDGKFTVGITNGVIFLENRLGSSQSVTAVFMTGVQ